MYPFSGVPLMHCACLRFVTGLVALITTLGAGLSLAATSVDDALSMDPVPHATHPASVQELTIPSYGARLPGHIYLANGPGPHPTVVLLHGLPGAERNLDLAQALRRFGFNSVFFHYRGAWGADGDYRFTQLPDDALSVLTWLRRPEQASKLRIDPDALSILGHSVGGFTALAAGSRDENLRCVVALAPANLGVWQRWVTSGTPEVDRLLAYTDSLFMLRGLSGARFREEIALAPAALLDTEGFGSGLASKSVMMVVGEGDTVTPAATMFDPVIEKYREAGVESLFALKLAGDHSFSQSRVQLTREILTWMGSKCRP